MKTRARIVQFTPDPFSGSRITVGALIEHGRRVEFVRAGLLPDSGCLGGPSAWTAMNLTLDALSNSGDFEQRNGAISQLATVGPAFELPDEVKDPLEWVANVLLPKKEEAVGLAPHARRERRATLGQALLKSWGVATLVSHQFRIENMIGGTLDVRLKHRPSHFVRAGAEVLLMEPFIGSRPSLEAELLEVKESFLAHQRLFDVAQQRYAAKYVAYVAPRGYRNAMSEVADALRPTGAELVNVDDPAQRNMLVSSIRTLSEKAAPYLPLLSS